MHEFYFDLGAMSQQKEDLIGGVTGRCNDCGHPLTAHTGTDAMKPWLRCARTDCSCLVMAGV